MTIKKSKLPGESARKPSAEETRDAIADPHSKFTDGVWVSAVMQLIHADGIQAVLLRIRRLSQKKRYRHCTVCNEHMRRDEHGDHHADCDLKFKAPHKRLLAEATTTKTRAHAAQMDAEHFGVHSGIETGVKR